MSFVSVIKKIGHGFAVGIGIADKVQSLPSIQAVESVFLTPAVTKLITAGVHAVAGAQFTAVTSVTPDMSGEQRAAIALAAFNEAYIEYAKAEGLPVEPDEVKAIIQAAFDLLNKIPTKPSPFPPNPTPTPIPPPTTPPLPKPAA